MSRLTLTYSLYGIFAAMTAPCAFAVEKAAPTSEITIHPIPGGGKPRNVVFILTDDHRYDAMGFAGHTLAITPNLDALAREGAHFPNALVTTSLCSPSRASILTGLYTFNHRVIDNNRPVPDGTRFFPQYLQKAGYSTALIGKWHMGHEDDAPRPGFDHWVSFRGQGRYLPRDTNDTLNVNGLRVPQRGYITQELTHYALEWLDKQRDANRPFFLYLSHKAVHLDFTPEDRYRGTLADRKRNKPTMETPAEDAMKPRWLRDQRNSFHGVEFPYYTRIQMEDYERAYFESLRSIDDSVGQVLAKLREMGIADDTLVIYMGDNGFMWGEHGIIDKRTAYEPSIRVPLVMRCPSLFPGGTVVQESVANIDIAPTVMEAMGLEKPGHMDGSSFLPLARGKKIPWREEFLYVYYWEKNFPQVPTTFALRTDRYKYISYYGIWDVDEFYDIVNDPEEKNNLLFDAKHQQLAKDFERRLYNRIAEMGAMEIPLNAPKGSHQSLRYGPAGGVKASDFPAPYVTEKPRHLFRNWPIIDSRPAPAKK